MRNKMFSSLKSNLSRCPSCLQQLGDDDKVCTGCGKPRKGQESLRIIVLASMVLLLVIYRIGLPSYVSVPISLIVVAAILYLVIRRYFQTKKDEGNLFKRIVTFFKGTLKRCPECNVEYIENDGWCRGCGEKRRKRSPIVRIAVFNALAGVLVLALLFLFWYLASVFAPDFAAQMFTGNMFYFNVWLEVGIVMFWSLMPLTFFAWIIDFIRGKG